MKTSDRRTLRTLAGEARAVLLDAAARAGGDDQASQKAASLDTWVALIGEAARRAAGADGDGQVVELGKTHGVRDTQAVADVAGRVWSDDLTPIWRDLRNLGWAYQYFIEPDLAVFRSQRGAKVGEGDVAIRTQQFTDTWIAEFLVHNTLGRLWLAMHPDSRLTAHMPYLVPLPDDAPSEAMRPIREIRILDPACGTMNFGLCAFDLLEAMYREELSHAGRAGWPETPSVGSVDDIGRTIIEHNLFGVDIDRRPLTLASLALAIRAGGYDGRASWNLICADTLARTDRWDSARYLDRQYDIVLLNPPYLDRREYSASIGRFMKRNYPVGGRNFYTAFLVRSLEFLKAGGRLGAVTPQTFMFISSLEQLRAHLAERTAIETLVQTGLNTFDHAVVDCAFYVLRRRSCRERVGRARFFRLTDLNEPAKMARRLRASIRVLRKSGNAVASTTYAVRQTDFEHLPGQAWVYWATPAIVALFDRCPRLGRVADLRQGLATTDNSRFVRFWWEIPPGRVVRDCGSLREAKRSGKTWFPYVKGGGFSKWVGRSEYVVNWSDDGRQIKDEIVRRYPYLKGKWQWVAKNVDFYFREGITYSYLTSRQFSARVLPRGFIFDVAGSGVFGGDPVLVLAVLNSRVCRFLLGLINATVNFQVGDLARLPVPMRGSVRLRELVERAVCLAKLLETFDETSPDFIAPAPWPDGVKVRQRIQSQLTTIQEQIDRELCGLYGLGEREQDLIAKNMGNDRPWPGFDEADLAYTWVSYAVGVALRRFVPGHIGRTGSGVCEVDHFDLRPIVKVGRSDAKKLLTEHGCLARSDRGRRFYRFERHVDSAVAELNVPLGPRGQYGVAIGRLAGAIRGVLGAILGRHESQRVIQTAAREQTFVDWLEREFFRRHLKTYRNRPLYWVLKPDGRGAASVLYYHRLNRRAWADLAARMREAGTGSDQSTRITIDWDDGIVLNVLPYHSLLGDGVYRRWLDGHRRRLLAGGYSWSSLAKHLAR